MRQAIGATMALVDAVVEQSAAKEQATGFGICRPPGHHALPTVMQGFCFLNTVACAARYAQENHGLKKVGIHFSANLYTLLSNIHREGHVLGGGMGRDKG